MQLNYVRSLDDPRLDPYREMRSRNWTEHSGIFVVEGRLLLNSLLASDYTVQSILLDEKRIGRIENLPPDTPCMVVPHALISELVGFDFHRGVLACGRRKAMRSVESMRLNFKVDDTLVALIGVQDPENLGSILRSSAALGVRDVIVGPGTADPLGRRALRVAMGTTLRLNLYRCSNMESALKQLQAREVSVVASSLEPNAQPLEQCGRSSAVALLLGNELNGLPAQVQQLADQKVRIDMKLGTDSLNVAVAAGILLHYFSRIAHWR